uniref:Importin subunit alpha n=1 Tax=Meloidogyne hapla TaxID=6305 RepID=A0A1I8BZQ8_MELHA
MSTENKAKLYKNAGKPDDLRRRRTESSVELRKQRGNDEMMKRRNLTVDLDESYTSASDNEEQPKDKQSKQSPEQVMTIEEAAAILQAQPTIEQIRAAFESVRRTLSRSADPPIDHIIQSGFPLALVQALSVQDEKVQFEAAWAITNIVSGTSTQTASVVSAGVIAPLLRIISTSSLKLAEQALWAIANIAGDSVRMRDALFAEGIVPILVELTKKVTPDFDPSFSRILAWTISNLCRHKKPPAPFEVLQQIAPSISILLKHRDLQTQSDACWALSYLTDGTDDNIGLAHKENVMPLVVEFINSGQNSLISPALRTAGNFATGNDELTSEVIDAKLLPIIFRILEHGEHKLQYEAGWAVANLAHGGAVNQILAILRVKGSIEAICSNLAVKNNELVANMLEALYSILHTVAANDPDRLTKVCERVEECGGLDKIEQLQQAESEQLYLTAYKIIDEFFHEDEDSELAIGMEEQQPQQGHFNF